MLIRFEDRNKPFGAGFRRRSCKFHSSEKLAKLFAAGVVFELAAAFGLKRGNRPRRGRGISASTMTNHLQLIMQRPRTPLEGRHRCLNNAARLIRWMTTIHAILDPLIFPFRYRSLCISFEIQICRVPRCLSQYFPVPFNCAATTSFGDGSIATR